MADISGAISKGEVFLGIELGSTRIKAVLISRDHTPIASGVHNWENRYENGVWTYALEDVWAGLQAAYSDLRNAVEERYAVRITKLAGIGISAMMHGFLAFDKEGRLLTPFRTWRNTDTERAAGDLTKLLSFNIPQRWSVSHLYQSLVYYKQSFAAEIDFVTTLSGYVHYKLTGERVIGIGDASGMFPIDSSINDFDKGMLRQFDTVIASHNMPWKLGDIFPKVLVAGESAGVLTVEGAKLLDISGSLKSGIPLCPPEGDAGTGMTATNSVTVRTGNVSAGTSVFAMIVLEKPLSKVYPEIDMVTTPSGAPVAMVHCNNCTNEINAWAGLFGEFAALFGLKINTGDLFEGLFRQAAKGDGDCGGLMLYNYASGEPVTGFEQGRPLFARAPESAFTLANFCRVNLYSAMAALNIGMEILYKEAVGVDRIYGHGGFFKTQDVGQQICAAALAAPVYVMQTAGEGGAWGMALLAAYAVQKQGDETLEHYLSEKVFLSETGTGIEPKSGEIEAFNAFIGRYKAGLAIERAAVETI